MIVRMLLEMVMVMFLIGNVTMAIFYLEGGYIMQPEAKFIITKAERQILELIRSLDYGEVRILVKDNKPIRVEEIRRSIQLPGEK